MKLNKNILFLTSVFSFSLFSCVKETNKNLTVPTDGRDAKVENFFNAMGLPLKDLDADDPEGLQADLSRVAGIFTNELPGKKTLNDDGEWVEHETSRPFFLLTQNVGLYFASQMWKTQITSTENVRFFDLAQDTSDNISGIQYASKSFDMPGVFLNPYADKTDPNNYQGSIVNGFYGKLNPSTQSFNPLSHFYVMEYQLRDGKGSKTGADVRTYYALVSIPTKLEHPNNTDQTRLIIYGHPGDYGTSPSDLIRQFATKLNEFVVVAPLFPGEPLCTQMSVQGTGCMRFNEENKLIIDNIGHYNNPYAPEITFNSIVPISYPRSPFFEDINAFLGAQNAVSRVMNIELNGLNPFYKQETENHSVLLSVEHPEELKNYFQSFQEQTYYDDLPQMIPTGIAPQTLAVGASRGGGVVFAAIGRVGFFLNGASMNTQFPHVVYDNGEPFAFQYPLMNSAALFFPPTSILTGKMRLMTIMVMKNEVDAIASIPMVTDLVNNPYFANYRNDENPLSEVQPAQKLSDGTFIEAQDSLTQLATYVASNDVTFMAPFVATGLQNWNSYYFDENVRAPGSMIFLHGSQDLIVPMTESTIAATAMSNVWAGLFHTAVDPFGNYLSSHKFAAIHPILKSSFIPGVGIAQYTFQPTKEFFNIPCDYSMLAAIQQPNVIYNSDVNRCFGGGYSPTGDGQNTVGQFYGHSDPSFYTSRLVNTFDDDLMHIGALSSNVRNKFQTNYKLNEDADRQMTFGGPKYSGYANSTSCMSGVKDCTFDYKIALNSPTFMRYLSDEGKLSSDIISAKKQVFSGDFKPNNTSNLKPHDVFFAWLESVACDWCEVGIENDEALFPQHFGVFHDFTQPDEPKKDSN